MKTITLLGSGNMAYCLGSAFFNAGYIINEVYSRNNKTGNKLATKFNSIFNSDLSMLNDDSDVYIICVSDNSIATIVASFPYPNKLIIHTSGNTSIDVFQKQFKKFGVIYPVQSLSANTIYDWNKIPICIEANSTNIKKQLKIFVSSISNEIYFLSSEARRKVHLSAVFANNFSNALYEIAASILKTEKISFKILHPLIEATANKAILNSPNKSQTGPAIRNDSVTMQGHLKMLKNFKEQQQIYKLISAYIQKSKSK